MIGNNWDELLSVEFEKDYMKDLLSFIKKEYKTKTIYPPQNNVCCNYSNLSL